MKPPTSLIGIRALCFEFFCPKIQFRSFPMRFLRSLGLAVVLAPTSLFAQFGTTQNFTATLTGYQVVPAVSTDAVGSFVGVLDLSTSSAEIVYSLSYSGLADPSAPTEIDVRFGQENANGGILYVLCGSGGGHAPCPRRLLRGALGPYGLHTVNNQNIAFDDFDKFLRALFAGKIYIDVHTTRVPSGELRGQIKAQAFQ